MHIDTCQLIVKHVFCSGLPWWLSDKESSAMQETWIQSLGWENLPEKEMAIHSSVLAWRIPWTEEPGGLQSMGSQKSRTQLSDKITTMFLFYSSCPTEPVTTEAT